MWQEAIPIELQKVAFIVNRMQNLQYQYTAMHRLVNSRFTFGETIGLDDLKYSLYLDSPRPVKYR